jgi:hypothetical protein
MYSKRPNVHMKCTLGYRWAKRTHIVTVKASSRYFTVAFGGAVRVRNERTLALPAKVRVNVKVRLTCDFDTLTHDSEGVCYHG